MGPMRTEERTLKNMTVGTPKRNLSTIAQNFFKMFKFFLEKVEKMNNFRGYFKQNWW